MKASDLKNVNEIDSTIQTLLGELTTLYQTRESLFKGASSKKPKYRNALRDDIDFSTFDLTIKD